MMINHRIREERRRIGLTQEDVAQALTVSSKTVCRWERGRLSPTLQMLVGMIDLGMDINYILTGYLPSPKPDKQILTPDEVKQSFKENGISVRQWADNNGFPRMAVYQVLNNLTKGNRGQSHQIAVALGIKADPSNSVERRHHA